MGGSNSTEGGMEGGEEEGGAAAAATTCTPPTTPSDTSSSQQDTVKAEAQQQEDVSEYIIHTEQDLGVKQYKITLHCEEDNVRLTKDDHVNFSISGTNRRRLVVTVGDRIYHRTRLPAGVKHCEVKPKKGKDEDLITVILDKTEHKLWKQ